MNWNRDPPLHSRHNSRIIFHDSGIFVTALPPSAHAENEIKITAKKERKLLPSFLPP